MPEGIEAEYYREALMAVVGQQLRSVRVEPREFLRPAGTSPDVLGVIVGCVLSDVKRIGKLVLARFDDAGRPVADLGLRFGMTGRLLIDGVGPIERLEYSSARNDPSWDRAVLQFERSQVAIRDPRRLGSIELDPDICGLGPDASDISSDRLEIALAGRRKALKATLLDQSIVAGLGNLLGDEVLWRSGLAPQRSAGDLTESEIELLATEIRATFADLQASGGSHTGSSFELRVDGASCSQCGETMKHDRVGGRSTWWCPGHQVTG